MTVVRFDLNGVARCVPFHFASQGTGDESQGNHQTSVNEPGPCIKVHCPIVYHRRFAFDSHLNVVLAFCHLNSVLVFIPLDVGAHLFKHAPERNEYRSVD